MAIFFIRSLIELVFALLLKFTLAFAVVVVVALADGSAFPNWSTSARHWLQTLIIVLPL